MNCAVCGRRAEDAHHVLYQQELRRHGGDAGDQDNVIPVCRACHFAHHSRSVPMRLSVLPDSAFAFAKNLLGPGPAYEYLRRRYRGMDARLDALLKDYEEAA